MKPRYICGNCGDKLHHFERSESKNIKATELFHCSRCQSTFRREVKYQDIIIRMPKPEYDLTGI
jgi:DNA-directed RNA polymerase subunit RPC12/RpoP